VLVVRDGQQGLNQYTVVNIICASVGSAVEFQGALPRLFSRYVRNIKAVIHKDVGNIRESQYIHCATFQII
jgi:hypothetical protein